MPVEPPVLSPRTLPEAYALLAAEAYRPVAGGTDLLVQITGEMGEPPERVHVVGNLKFDLAGVGPATGGTDGPAVRQMLGLPPSRPVLVAGSTHRGEEGQHVARRRRVHRVPTDRSAVLDLEIGRASCRERV